MKMKTLSVAAASAALFSSLALSSAFAEDRPCPSKYPDADTSSSEAMLVPDTVCIPDGVVAPGRLAYFDDYSWRAFIALVWPAAGDQRGQGDPQQSLEQVNPSPPTPDSPALVFETFKAEWETFPQRRQAHPTDWDVLDDPADETSMWSDVQRACASGATKAKAGDFFLAPSTKLGSFENVQQAGFPANVLVAQNGTLARYLAAYNEHAYRYILSRGVYLAKNLPKSLDESHGLDFPPGSVNVKSSWIDLGKVGDKPAAARPETFHRRLAWLIDPFDPALKCEQHVVGLVGLHIVQKAPGTIGWVWASFEHSDNAPDRAPPLRPLDPPDPIVLGCPIKANPLSLYSFNEKAARMKGLPPVYLVSAIRAYTQMQLAAGNQACPPPPVNIERIRRINQDPSSIVTRSTDSTNKVWQNALQTQSSVWQYYRLVLTQWSTAGTYCPGVGCGDQYYTVPGFTPDSCIDQPMGCNHLPASAVANTTMETWLQDDDWGGDGPKARIPGCMACHNKVGVAAPEQEPLDFVFSLRVNAYPPQAARESPAIRSLGRLMGTLSQ
jgi:hypothetical protein